MIEIRPTIDIDLIVDIDTLESVDLLYLVNEVFLEFSDAADFEDLVWNDEAVGELLPFDNVVAALYDEVFVDGDEMFFFHPCHLVTDEDDTLIFLYAEVYNAIEFSYLCSFFRSTGFEELGYPG